MRAVYLIATSTAQPIGPVHIAESGWDRTRGLLGRPALQGSEGLFITRCASVHTVGMQHAIDVVFVDRTGRIVRIAERLAPMRVAMCRSASSVLELATGQARALGLLVGANVSGWQTEKEPA
ncbi:DUF192 domain-containing protein [soil metagenome]